MKPTKKIKQIVRWDCGNPEHSHKTVEVAQACMKKRAATTPHRTPQEKMARSLTIARAVVNGATLTKAGKLVGVKAERARILMGWPVRLVVGHRVLRGMVGEPPGGEGALDRKSLRQHKEYWLKALDAVEKYWWSTPK